MVPKWIFDLVNNKQSRIGLSLKMQITPLLMQMRYKQFPLYHRRASGWGFLVPAAGALVCSAFTDCEPFENPDKTYSEAKLDAGDFETLKVPPGSLHFFKLPHASGTGINGYYMKRT